MTDRRTFIGSFAGGLLAATLGACDQPPNKIVRIAMLHVNPPFSDAFSKRLRELGYAKGQNLLLDLQDSDVPLARLPALALEYASHRPNVFVAGGSEFVLDAVKRAAVATPIVMVFVDFDPVATGQVASLSRPGGNITGLYLQQHDLAAKRLELLKEAFPPARRIAVLFDAFTREQQRRAQAAANTLDVTVLPQELRDPPYDYEHALRNAINDKADAVLILSSGEFFMDRFKIMSAIHRLRLPSMANTTFADAGPLLCYGANFSAMFARAAEYADRILKGEKPAEMAIEQPTKFELIVNLKTAGSLGVTIPQSLLLRANEVIK